MKQLFLICTYSGIALGIFVVVLLNSRRTSVSRANLFLSILLIALSFSIAHILFAGIVVSHFSSQVYSLGDPTFYLIAPFLWFYIKELTGHYVKIKWNLGLHFLPFLLIVFLSLTIRSFSPENGMLIFLDHHQRLISVAFWMILLVQFSGYQIMIRRKWLTYQDMIQQEVSNTENIDISWVRFFMTVFLLINLFFFFSLFAAIHLESGAWHAKTTALVFSMSVFALGYKGLLQKEVLQKTMIATDSDQSTTETKQVSFQSDPGQIELLQHHMETRKPFLNPELTLSGLARELDMGRSQLSQLINSGIGDNFYDFINKYRVEEVKRLMVDPKKGHFNMLGIALEAGFKSKSTFNLIFKRFTGLTPSAYRKNISR